MTQDKARKRAIRERMAQTGEPFSVAARHLDATAATAADAAKPDWSRMDAMTEADWAVVDARTAAFSAIWAGWGDESRLESAHRRYRDAGGTERLWLRFVEVMRASKAAKGDAVAAAQLGVRSLPADATPAHRAAAEASWHPMPSDLDCRCSGQCRHGQPCDLRCEGLLVHESRTPDGPSDVTLWADVHECDTCGTRSTVDAVTLPELPWGETVGENGTMCYPNVYHPDFPDTWPS